MIRFFLLFIAFLGVIPLALAQSPGDTLRQAAAAYWNGLAAEERGRWEDAVANFAKAAALLESPGEIEPPPTEGPAEPEKSKKTEAVRLQHLVEHRYVVRHDRLTRAPFSLPILPVYDLGGIIGIPSFPKSSTDSSDHIHRTEGIGEIYALFPFLANRDWDGKIQQNHRHLLDGPLKSPSGLPLYKVGAVSMDERLMPIRKGEDFELVTTHKGGIVGLSARYLTSPTDCFGELLLTAVTTRGSRGRPGARPSGDPLLAIPKGDRVRKRPPKSIPGPLHDRIRKTISIALRPLGYENIPADYSLYPLLLASSLPIPSPIYVAELPLGDGNLGLLPSHATPIRSFSRGTLLLFLSHEGNRVLLADSLITPRYAWDIPERLAPPIDLDRDGTEELILASPLPRPARPGVYRRTIAALKLVQGKLQITYTRLPAIDTFGTPCE